MRNATGSSNRSPRCTESSERGLENKKRGNPRSVLPTCSTGCTLKSRGLLSLPSQRKVKAPCIALVLSGGFAFCSLTAGLRSTPQCCWQHSPITRAGSSGRSSLCRRAALQKTCHQPLHNFWHVSLLRARTKALRACTPKAVRKEVGKLGKKY